MALPAAGEFGRVRRLGDTMKGNLKYIDINDPTYQSIVEFIATLGGPLVGGIRLNGNDLEFYDSTVLAWVKLSQLTGHLGDIHYVVPAPGQFVFNLPFTYVIGSNTLQVELVGVSRVPGPGAPVPIYAETLGNQVTFLNGPAGIAPWTPFLGTELLIFFVPGRPNVNDTYTVKGDAPDASPNYLPNKLAQAGAVQITTVGSPANTQAQIDVPFATGISPASGGAGAVGVSTNVVRQDHQHPAPPQDPPLGSATPLVESGAGSAGVSGNASREDHVHPAQGPNPPLGSATPLVESGAGSAGVSSNASREDHVHPAGGGVAPPVSGMKGATLVGAGSIAIIALRTYIGLEVPGYGVYRFYWAAGNYMAYPGATLNMNISQAASTVFPNATTGIVIQVDTVGGTVGYRVYRVDEI